MKIGYILATANEGLNTQLINIIQYSSPNTDDPTFTTGLVYWMERGLTETSVSNAPRLNGLKWVLFVTAFPSGYITIGFLFEVPFESDSYLSVIRSTTFYKLSGDPPDGTKIASPYLRHVPTIGVFSALSAARKLHLPPSMCKTVGLSAKPQWLLT